MGRNSYLSSMSETAPLVEHPMNDNQKKLDDEVGYFGVSRRAYGPTSETLYIVTELPARYGKVREICEEKNRLEKEYDPDPEYYFVVVRLTEEEVKQYRESRTEAR